MRFPPNLRRWSGTLSALVPELALALGPMIERLDALLGPMARRADPGGADPDGYVGLSRRGPYERLSLTEWVLADELPDEFLRRAVMGEHLFLELDRRTPGSGRQCVVALDAGPDQLGSPRIGQLALLIVLARRAAEAKALLRWRVVQSGAEPARTGIDGAGVRALLAGRSASDPTSAGIRELLDGLGPFGVDDEVWMVGGRTLARVGPRSAWHCRIEEDWLVHEEELQVDVTRPGAHPRRVRLPLPPVEQRVQLIRDPIARRPGAPSRRGGTAATYRGVLAPDLRFSPEGQRLLAREEQGAVLAYRVELGAARKPSRREVSSEERVVATGWSHQSLTALVRGGDGRVTLLSGGEATVISGIPPSDRGARPGDVLRFRKPGWAVLRDDRSQLWKIPLDGSTSQVQRHGTALCLAATRRDSGLLTVLTEGRATRLEWTTSREVRIGDMIVEAPAFEAHIGPATSPYGIVALRLGPGRWRTAPTPGIWLEVGPDEHVWGVTLTEDRATPGLLVSRAYSTLVVRTSLGPRADRVLAGPILTACSSPGPEPRVAWMTPDRRVVVWDMVQQEQILEILPPEAR